MGQETRNGITKSSGLRVSQAAVKELVGAEIVSQLPKGSVCFWTHCGCWKDSASHRRSDGRLNQMGCGQRLSSVPCRVALPIQPLNTWNLALAEWESEREQETLSHTETKSFSSHLLDMTYHDFCSILFVGIESLGPAQIEEKEISLEYREAGITGSHFRSHLSQQIPPYLHKVLSLLSLCLVFLEFSTVEGQSSGHHVPFLSLACYSWQLSHF